MQVFVNRDWGLFLIVISSPISPKIKKPPREKEVRKPEGEV
jgi:hypothetical protein